MKYSDILVKVSKEINLPKDIIDKTYKAYWKSIKNMIQQLPLKEELSEEAFSKLKCNINIPSIGKFNCTYNRFLNIKNRYNYKKGEDVKNKEN